MLKTLIHQAKGWGFLCTVDVAGNWQIAPKESIPNWRLRLIQDRWILIVGDSPQISFRAEEALAFINYRFSRRKADVSS